MHCVKIVVDIIMVCRRVVVVVVVVVVCLMTRGSHNDERDGRGGEREEERRFYELIVVCTQKSGRKICVDGTRRLDHNFPFLGRRSRQLGRLPGGLCGRGSK
jgi:hypothetical protein